MYVIVYNNFKQKKLYTITFKKGLVNYRLTVRKINVEKGHNHSSEVSNLQTTSNIAPEKMI